MKRRLLVLVSPLGEAMAREAAELCAAFARDFEIRTLAVRSERSRFERAGSAFTPFRPSGIIGMGRAVATLRRTVQRFDPDVVHVHGFAAASVALGTFPEALARRTIATFHDPLRDKELPEKLVDRRFPAYLARASAVSATYPSLQDMLERRFALPAGSVAVIPHGVDDALGATALARPGGRLGPVIGWSGTLAADRSWETAIDGLAAVRVELFEARLVIAGSGPARQFVAAQVRRQKLSNMVRFAGEVPHAELFAAIDMLVVPISRDAQPHVLLEALAAGIPVVASAGGALADAVQDYETGWLVDDDAAGIALGVRDAWSQIDRAWEGAAEQRGAARVRYGRSSVVAAYRRLYDAALAARDA